MLKSGYIDRGQLDSNRSGGFQVGSFKMKIEREWKGSSKITFDEIMAALNIINERIHALPAKLRLVYSNYHPL